MKGVAINEESSQIQEPTLTVVIFSFGAPITYLRRAPTKSK